MDDFLNDVSDDDLIPVDTDNDGLLDSLVSYVDLNEDVLPDAMMITSDENGDGVLDSQILLADLDGDGNIDFTEYGFDSDGDGAVDSEFMVMEADGDLELDYFASDDSSGSIWDDVDSASVAEQDADSFTANYANYNEVHGSPIEDMELWDQQDDPMSCAVATANMMFRTVGLDVGESEIAAVFESHGIYDPDFGTNPNLIDDVINDMAIHGDLDIHAEEITGFTPESLEEMLDQGIRPLVGLDSSELYDSGNRLLNEMGLIPDTGHAVQVTGIVHNEEGDFVVINDPGLPEGAGQMIPMEDFMGASEDFGHTAVAMMDGAPPSLGNDYHWGARAAAGLAFSAVAMARSETQLTKKQPNEKK